MSNSEIKAKIAELQAELENTMASSFTFELNSAVLDTKNKINALRDQCSHTAEDGNFARPLNGRCPYCGKKV